MTGVVGGHPFASRAHRRREPEPPTDGVASRDRSPQWERRSRSSRGDHLPMVVTGGPLRALDWTSPTASAQVKSAILLAGLVGRVPVSVTEPVKSRDHTERMLGALGVEVRSCGGQAALTPAPELSCFRARRAGRSVVGRIPRRACRRWRNCRWRHAATHGRRAEPHAYSGSFACSARWAPRCRGTSSARSAGNPSARSRCARGILSGVEIRWRAGTGDDRRAAAAGLSRDASRRARP